MPRSIQTKTLTPRRLRPLAGAAFLSVALVVAGCGGSSGPTIAHLSSVKDASTASSGSSGSSPERPPSVQDELKFSECMRANGVPSFPDPNAQGLIPLSSSFNPSSPQFQEVQQKCATYSPGKGRVPSTAQQAQFQARLLAFGQCMRSHGAPAFPDPTVTSVGGVGAVGFRDGPKSGLDKNSPIFQHAQNECGSLLPGRLPSTLGK